jgi:hypothetical protein
MKSKFVYCAYGLVAVIGFSFLSGCAAQQRYSWNDYDKKVYDFYKSPVEKDEFVKNLKEVLDDSESAGNVPPGIYAEYGYVLYEQGNSIESVMYFQKEADKWPESKFFMSKLISNAQKKAKKQEVKPAGVPATSGVAAPGAPADQAAALDTKVIATPEVAK